MGVQCMVEKIYWKGMFSVSEWKREGVMDDESGDGEGDEGEEEWVVQGCIFNRL